MKEFVGLIEDNMVILNWLNTRTKGNMHFKGYSGQHLRTVVRLYLGGKTLLKEFAKRSEMPASNLCTMLKHLEEDGLVLRQVDDSDRRNTWYSLTPAGTKLAKAVLEEFRQRIAELFSGLCKTDEVRLTSALRTMNELLNKVKNSYNKE